MKFLSYLCIFFSLFLTACGGEGGNSSSEPELAREVPVTEEAPVVGNPEGYNVTFYPYSGLTQEGSVSAQSITYDDVMDQAVEICLIIDYSWDSCNPLFKGYHEEFQLYLPQGHYEIKTILLDQWGEHVASSFVKKIEVQEDTSYELGKNFPYSGINIRSYLFYEDIGVFPKEIYYVLEGGYKRKVSIYWQQSGYSNVSTYLHVGGSSIKQVCLIYENDSTVCYDVSSSDFESLILAELDIDLTEFEEVELVSVKPEDGACFLDSNPVLGSWYNESYNYYGRVQFYCPNTDDKYISYKVEIFVDGELYHEFSFEEQYFPSDQNNIYFDVYGLQSEYVFVRLTVNSITDYQGNELSPDKSVFEFKSKSLADLDDLLQDLLEGLD